MARRKSGQRTPKQIAAELARQREKYPGLLPVTDGVMPQAGADLLARTEPFGRPANSGGFPCRAHGVPWRDCQLCSPALRKR